MLMIAGLAHRGIPYTQYAARGQAPMNSQRHTRICWPTTHSEKPSEREKKMRTAFPWNTSPSMPPCEPFIVNWSAIGVVGIAFDGRIGHGWFPALPEPDRIAQYGPLEACMFDRCHGGARLLPHAHQRSRHNQCGVPPFLPGANHGVIWPKKVWPFKRAGSPATPRVWNLDAPRATALESDDHPLFTDNAPDDRYLRWMGDDETLTEIEKRAMDIDALINALSNRLGNRIDPAELEEVRRLHTGKKSPIKAAFKELRNVAPEDRSAVASALNDAQSTISDELETAAQDIGAKALAAQLEQEWQDLTMPGQIARRGARHPLTEVENQCMDVLRRLGFEPVDGPEIDAAYYNFDALNIPEHHPARDMQDAYLGIWRPAAAFPHNNRASPGAGEQAQIAHSNRFGWSGVPE